MTQTLKCHSYHLKADTIYPTKMLYPRCSEKKHILKRLEVFLKSWVHRYKNKLDRPQNTHTHPFTHLEFPVGAQSGTTVVRISTIHTSVYTNTQHQHTKEMMAVV